VLKCCRDIFAPLRKQVEWGYSLPYAITGILNQHPRAAIEWRAGQTPTITSHSTTASWKRTSKSSLDDCGVARPLSLRWRISVWR